MLDQLAGVRVRDPLIMAAKVRLFDDQKRQLTIDQKTPTGEASSSESETAVTTGANHQRSNRRSGRPNN